MKLKKYITLGLTAIAVSSLLIGCSSENTTSDTKTQVSKKSTLTEEDIRKILDSMCTKGYNLDHTEEGYNIEVYENLEEKNDITGGYSSVDHKYSLINSYKLLAQYLSVYTKEGIYIRDIDSELVSHSSKKRIHEDGLIREKLNKELFNLGIFQKGYNVSYYINDSIKERATLEKYFIYTPVEYEQEYVDNIVNICKKQKSNLPIEIYQTTGYVTDEPLIYSETDNPQVSKETAREVLVNQSLDKESSEALEREMAKTIPKESNKEENKQDIKQKVQNSQVDNTQEARQDTEEIEPRGGFGYCSLCNESYSQYELTSTYLSSGEKVIVCPKCLKDINSGMYDNVDMNNAN